MITLHAWSKRDVTLTEAFGATPEEWRIERPVALLYTPAYCRLGRLQVSGDVETINENEQPETADLMAVFEARAFCTSGELRWLHEGRNKGRAVFLSEGGSAMDGWEALDPINALEKGKGHYLLWGEGWCPTAERSGSSNKAIVDGWSWLATSRIGKLAVPLGNIDAHERVCLLYKEYYGFDWGPAGKDHGNVVVLEERLIGLQKAKTADQQVSGEACHDAA
jgi:CRISPR-associated protein (TIGR03984 family)